MMYWHNNASRTYRAGKQGKDAMLICTPVTDDAEATYSCACHSPAFARLNAVIEQRLSRRAFLAGAAPSRHGAVAEGGRGPPCRSAPADQVCVHQRQIFDGKEGT